MRQASGEAAWIWMTRRGWEGRVSGTCGRVLERVRIGCPLRLVKRGRKVCVGGSFSRKGRGSKIVHSFLGRALSAEGYLNKERIYGDSAPGETPPKWRSRFVYRGNH